MTYASAATDRMARSRRVVEVLLDSAHEQASQANDAAAVTLLGAAASLSRRRHSGCFTNPKLESLLHTLGQRLRGPAARGQPSGHARMSGAASGGVLHVMTRGYAAGGHTRLVERWIEGEPDVISSVVLSQPGGTEPGRLTATVERSGGRVHQLQGSAMDRARQLRVLAAGRDRIVLSIHENDVVPLLALAGMQHRPPLLTLNHAEHVFWAGASLADVVVSLRPASSDLAVARRGVPSERSAEMPLPVPMRQRKEAAGEARRALGIERDSKVLLTVGWRYKYTPYRGDDLIAALAPILDEPDVHLVAVGPRPDDQLWSAARARFGGRVLAAGRQEDIQPFLDAADVFVDSYPIASLTAALEAAISGLAVVGLAPRDARWPRILREDDPALARAMFDDVDVYRAQIRALLRNEDARRAASRALQEVTIHTHGPNAWASAMQRVHQTAAVAAHERRRLPALAPVGAAGTEDEILATYIADCEDQLIRPELRLTPDEWGNDDRDGGALDAIITRIEELLLQPAPPDDGDYNEALSLARGATMARVFSGGCGRPSGRRNTPSWGLRGLA